MFVVCLGDLHVLFHLILTTTLGVNFITSCLQARVLRVRKGKITKVTQSEGHSLGSRPGTVILKPCSFWGTIFPREH